MEHKSLWLVAAAFFVSCVTVSTRLTGGQYTFYEILFGKYVLMTLVVGGLLLIEKKSWIPKNPCLLGVRCGFGVAAAAFNTILILQVPAALAQTLNYTSAIWIALFFCLQIKELTLAKALTFLFPVVIGAAGILIIFNPNFGYFGAATTVFAILYGISVAGGSISLRELGKRKESPLLVTFWFCASCLVFSVVVSLFNADAAVFKIFEDPKIYLIVFFAFLYQLSRTIGWEFGNPFINSCVLFLGVPFVISLGYVFLEELPSSRDFLGIALIIISSLASFWVQSRKR